MAVDYYSSYDDDQQKVEEQREEEEEEEEEDDDDDYIDMEVSFFDLSPAAAAAAASNSVEFEFQMSSSMNVPADQLFYMGKLLPLHLPPRLQLLHKILQDSNSNAEEFYSTPSPLSTPFESCDVSPVDSCHVSTELNTQDCLDVFANCHTNMSWTKKLKTKFKSLFGIFVKRTADQSLNSKAKGRNETPQNDRKDGKFSRALKPSSLISCSSYSSSNFEIEATLIQGAIAHCKQSSQY